MGYYGCSFPTENTVTSSHFTFDLHLFHPFLKRSVAVGFLLKWFHGHGEGGIAHAYSRHPYLAQCEPRILSGCP
jgi:hypothetical protein